MGFILTFFAKNIDMSTMVKTEVFLGYLLEMLGSELHIFTARKRNLGQCNVFTPVCQSFCSQGGSASGEGGLHPVGGGGQRAPPLGYYGIQSTSGLYASYWNAFFFQFLDVWLHSGVYVYTAHLYQRSRHCWLSRLGLYLIFWSKIARNINWKSITDTGVDGRCWCAA